MLSILKNTLQSWKTQLCRMTQRKGEGAGRDGCSKRRKEMFFTESFERRRRSCGIGDKGRLLWQWQRRLLYWNNEPVQKGNKGGKWHREWGDTSYGANTCTYLHILSLELTVGEAAYVPAVKCTWKGEGGFGWKGGLWALTPKLHHKVGSASPVLAHDTWVT